jgi:hypothetical protein
LRPYGRCFYEQGDAVQGKNQEYHKKSQVPAQAVLQNYILEHLLERISISGYKDKFVLKGGMLIASL